jgi:PhoH-like ATPase
MKRIYVLDTNVLLTDHQSIYGYGNNDIIIPLKVLEEIDKHKKRHDGVGANARGIIRVLDGLRASGNLHKGVRLRKKLGIVSVKGFDSKHFPPDLDSEDPDNQIICTALTEKATTKRKVIVVSRDINMRVKCDSLEMLCEDYASEKVVQDTSKLYTGFTLHLVDDQVVDHFYAGEDVFIDEEEIKLSTQQFIMLVSNQNEKKTALAKFVDYNTPVRKVNDYQKNGIWGLRPRNKEQQFALDMLMDENISIVTIIGKAGSGKSLMAIAAGLEQVVETGLYKKMVVSRPVEPMGKDIGFLPGTMEEKMRPWLMPIQDNLEFLMNGQHENMEHLFEDKTIEIEALTYIRGRSISKAFIIIDEAQNLTIHELKTIITRVGEGSKVVLTGDIEQIDNVYIDSTSNGLTYAVERFKTYDLSGHITLQKGERSKIATLAAKIL